MPGSLRPHFLSVAGDYRLIAVRRLARPHIAFMNSAQKDERSCGLCLVAGKAMKEVFQNRSFINGSLGFRSPHLPICSSSDGLFWLQLRQVVRLSSMLAGVLHPAQTRSILSCERSTREDRTRRKRPSHSTHRICFSLFMVLCSRDQRIDPECSLPCKRRLLVLPAKHPVVTSSPDSFVTRNHRKLRPWPQCRRF